MNNQANTDEKKSKEFNYEQSTKSYKSTKSTHSVITQKSI